MQSDRTAYRIPTAHRDTRPWDLAQAYALAFGVLATQRSLSDLLDAEEAIGKLDPLDTTVPAEVRAIAIDALARAQDRARKRAWHEG